MSKLILVRHSSPEIVPTQPANLWHLAFEGHSRCKPLAENLAPHAPEVVITSTEIKAIQTGRRIAEQLNIPYEIVDHLHEHDRHTVPFGTREVFEAHVAEFFAKPDELVFGLETAHAAQSRFTQAVEGVIERHLGQTVAIVAHGTVITLFVNHHVEIDPFSFWKQLNLPSFVVLSLPEFGLMEIVTQVL